MRNPFCGGSFSIFRSTTTIGNCRVALYSRTSTSWTGMGILVDTAPDPERALEAEEQLHMVVSVVSAMSRRTCQIFIAQRAGYSYEEVAAAFAIKPRTVEKHVTVATSALMQMMPSPSSGPRLSG